MHAQQTSFLGWTGNDVCPFHNMYIGKKFDPHAHHILFKEGNGPAQKALVKEGQAILRRYGIDPIMGLVNLGWAPNRVAGQHGIEALTKVVEQLKAVEEFGGTRYYIKKKLIKALMELGRQAATRR